MNHFCRLKDITVKTKLTAQEAYNIAVIYQKTHEIAGLISSDINEAIYLDEMNHITKGITWMIRSKLEENSFEGMDEFTIMVSDDSKQVSHVLDHNGIPMYF